MEEILYQIQYGKLIQPYMGYAIGARIYTMKCGGMHFSLLIDEEDETWGTSLSNIEIPKIEAEKQVELILENQVKFFTYVNLINGKAKIPNKCDFTFSFND